MSNVIKLNVPPIAVRYKSVAKCSGSFDVAGFTVEIAIVEGDSTALHLILLGPPGSECIETLMTVKNSPEALTTLLKIGEVVFDGITAFWLHEPDDRNGGGAA